MKLIFIMLLSFKSFALVNFGTYVPSAFKAQSDKDGGSPIFAINPFISFDYIFPPIMGNYFNPEIGYVFHLDAEDETSHKTIFLNYNFDVPFSPLFVFRWGFSNFLDRVGGDGDSVELKNGTSTATFYTPSETRTSYTSSLNLGFKTFVNQKWAVRFDGNIMQFLSSDKRAFSYLLSLNYN